VEDGSGGDSDEQVGDGVSSPEPWGRWTQALAIAPCAVGAELVVNTTGQELEGGSTLADPANAGSTLSFVEAITIAVNRGGTNTILFDPAVFPIENPTPIQLDGTVSFPMSQAQGTCIDGRGRGVVIEWSGGGDMPLSVWGLGTGSRMIGLTLLGVPFEISVFDAEVAGCRIDTDGFAIRNAVNGRPWSLETTRSEFGPGNVMAGSTLRAWSDSIIHDSYFGVDPITRATFESSTGIHAESSHVKLTGCEFAVGYVGVDANPGGFDPLFDFLASDNVFGPVTPGHGGVGLRIANHVGTLGPGNQFTGLEDGLFIMADARMLVVENSFSVNSTGVRLFGPSALRRNTFHGNTTAAITSGLALIAPELTTVSNNHVAGTCSVDGTIELFLDDAGQAGEYLGEAPCVAASGFSWDAGVGLASGLAVTATLTDVTPQTSALSQPVTIP